MQNESGEKHHLLTIDDRAGVTLTGITDVPSFCEQTIVAATSCGNVTIMGDGLHISRLSLNEGLVEIEGTVNALEYSAHSSGKKGFMGRLWK